MKNYENDLSAKVNSSWFYEKLQINVFKVLVSWNVIMSLGSFVI